jgi:hypothetical protein
MNGRRLIPLLASLAILASACTQQNTGDEPAASTAPQGLNRFLLFPNPVAMNSGGFETNTTSYADAYYRAIDPTNLKDTIDKWKTQNGFGSGTGTEKLAVFRDAKDLGYGRRMTGRQNTDGSVAFYVENYNVAPNGASGYASILNVEAAINRDTRWHVGTNAIEWSSTPCGAGDPADCSGTIKFAKYYNFSSKDGTRQLAVDLDGNGLKAMPGPCITCHGGRGDPLTPDEGNPAKPRFPLVENSVSRKRGDVQARLHGMNVDSFDYSPDIAGFSKSDQQATLKQFNQWILCTYPLAGAAAGAEDACRVVAGANEWQGTAAEMIKSWYGGPGMPNGTFLDTYVPTGWQASASVYTSAVAPFCRTCHILRGTKNQDDIDFMTSAKFLGYADRIKAHVFDRGTMPLALIVYDDFWGTNAPNQIANFINPTLGALTPAQTATDSSGTALKPGRPIANPGPNRMVKTGTNAILTAENSLFASSFSWSVISGSATITNPNAMIATFNAPAAGDVVVQLTVGNGTQTDTKNVTITASNSFPDPAGIKFAQVKNVLQNVSHTTSQASGKCTDCHKDVATPAPATTPPIWYTSFDRDGVGGVTTTDDQWFAKALQGRINLTEIDASPLLRKPSGNHHNGKMLLDPSDKVNGGLRDYSILYNWILGGMPAGGVAANAGADTISPPVTVTFAQTSPGVFAASIPLDGSGSIGSPLTFSWSATPPNGLSASFSPSATVQSPNLIVPNVGTYVAHLQVSDGVSTDTAQRTIVVAETPLTFGVTVVGEVAGTVQVTFAGSPTPTGTISVTSAQTTGTPVSCLWSVGPTVQNPLATGVSLGANSCSGATLNAATAAIGNQFQVNLTQQNVSQPPVSVGVIFTVAAAAGSNPSGANFNAITTTQLGWSVATPGGTASRTLAGASGVTLQGSAAGPGTLNFSWSIQSQGTTGCTIPGGASTATTKLLSVTGVGTCNVTLTVSNGILPNATITKGITITSSVVLSNVATILGASGDNCTSCHNGVNAVPSWANDAGLASRLATVINGTQSSLLLLCPTFGAGAGGDVSCSGMPAPQAGFQPGVNLTNYNAFLTWIFNGQP